MGLARTADLSRRTDVMMASRLALPLLALALAACAADAPDAQTALATTAAPDSAGQPAAAVVDSGASTANGDVTVAAATDLSIEELAPGAVVNDTVVNVPVPPGRTKRDSLALVRTIRAGRSNAAWPVKGPAARAGAILPNKRIVCYYGNPNSTRMGALGEFPKDEMLGKLTRQIDEWRKADPGTPVQPCLHMVAVVAQGAPGPSGHWRTIQRDADVQKVHGWAREVDGIFFVDIQVGTDDIRNILPRFEWILKEKDVHLAIDPEFYMKGGQRPGAKIGTMDAADINYATKYLADLVEKHDLPPKVLVIHRFTRGMVTNSKQIKLRPEVQVVMHMDGWGAPWLKYDSYRDYIVAEPVQYAGFKLFYGNDTKKGDKLLTPKELVLLQPKLHYIQYQ